MFGAGIARVFWEGVVYTKGRWAVGSYLSQRDFFVLLQHLNRGQAAGSILKVPIINKGTARRRCSAYNSFIDEIKAFGISFILRFK